MGHNYLKNDANLGKIGDAWNSMKFPIKCRKPNCSTYSCLEMTSKLKLLHQVENDKKITFQNLIILSATLSGTNAPFLL